jgi:hypothetical protein
MSAIAPRLRAGLVCLGLLTSATLAFAADDTALRLFNADGGNSGYVRVANSPAFSLQQFTLEAWIQRVGPGSGISTDPSGAAILAKPIEGQSGSNIASWHMHWTPNGEIHFNLTHTATSSGVYILSSPVATPTARHHLAVTFDGATISLYIDGLPKGSASWNLGSVYYGANDVLIGADNFSFGYLRRFDGFIDDVRIWDHALTQTEISSTMNCHLTGTEAGLVAYWTFDSFDFSDLTGHGHVGVPNGSFGGVTYGSLGSIPICSVGVPRGDLSSGFALALYPQPALNYVTMSFELPTAGPVTIDAVDVAGRRLATLAEQDYPAGQHELKIELSALRHGRNRAGMVFVRLRRGSAVVTRPLVILE